MRIGAVSLLVSLGGCSSLMGLAPDADYQVLIQAVIDRCDVPPPSTALIDPSTYMEVGFGQVQAACEVFFVEATRAQQNALAANRGFDALLVAAAAILPQTNSAATAAKALAITTAGIVLTKTLIDNYTSIYAFNTHLYKVRSHVVDSMEHYMADARLAPPRNYCLAYTYVQKLASLCSLAAMKANLDEQVALDTRMTPIPPSPLRVVRSSTLRTLAAPAVVRARTVSPAGSPPSISYRPTF